MKTLTKKICTFLAAIAAVFVVAAASAGTVNIAYSIDVDTNTLVTIDLQSAEIEEVGMVNLDSEFVVGAMAFANGTLFALATITPQGANLLEIDHTTGEVLSTVPITIDGAAVSNAVEGLTADEDGLVITLWGGGRISSSNQVGRLALDGAVTELVFYDEDYDGICWDSGDIFVTVDREPGPSTVEFREIVYDGRTVSSTSIAVLPITGVFNGVEECLLDDEVILTLDVITQHLHRLDRTTGEILKSLPYHDDYTLRVLARMESGDEECLGDINGDDVVDGADLGLLLGAFGSDDGEADLNGDGKVDGADLGLLLGAFGPCV